MIDWAHVHAKSGGGLTSRNAFLSVIAFLRSEFPGWAIDPLHTQFTDNEFGSHGEIRHLPYGDGSLRSNLLGEAAAVAGLRMVVISEAREESSHELIHADLRTGIAAVVPEQSDNPATLANASIDFPDPISVVPDQGGFRTVGLDRMVRIPPTLGSRSLAISTPRAI